MLELRGITKSYTTANLTQVALNRVDLTFRDNEFVAILGQSGSGKTTMLNVIGGLDQFDDGDLVIDGISTRDFKDRDWDTYRNNRIGFVFQAYNLIGHQSVLANVELALTLSGVGRSERRRRAVDALTSVGLADHIHKKPNQLSGGQMQRVAIARALVNDPEIVLADEPTGALDSRTSVQVMDLLKEVAKDRLVIMVTHNPELAYDYATRIVELADGQVIADSQPFDPATDGARSARESRKTSMSFLTALSLSFNNLRTKKGRTLMTAIAGSIGIIGIAAILSLSNGVNEYIARTEEETLASYPLQIQKTGADMGAIFESFRENGGPEGAREKAIEDAQSARPASTAQGDISSSGYIEEALGSVTHNDLGSLRAFLETNGGGINDHVSAIEYSYDLTPRIYLSDTSKGPQQVNPSTLNSDIAIPEGFGPMVATSLSSNSFRELPTTRSLYDQDYTLAAGSWPDSADELLLVLDPSGTIEENLEYDMGLRDRETFRKYIESRTRQQSTPLSLSGSVNANSAQASGTENAADTAQSSAPLIQHYDYDDLLAVQFTSINAADLYSYDTEQKIWVDRSEDDAFVSNLIAEGTPLRISGIAQAKEGAKNTILPVGLHYTRDLSTQLMDYAGSSEIVKAQMRTPDINVLSGKKFSDEEAEGTAGNELSIQDLLGFDAEKLSASFAIDESAFQNAFAALDLSQIDMSGLDLSKLDTSLAQLPPMDFSDFDLSAMDLSAIDPSKLNLDPGALAGSEEAIANAVAQSLQDQLPELANIDWAKVLTEAGSDNAISAEALPALSAVSQELLEEFVQFQANYPDPTATPQQVAEEFFAQPEVTERIQQALTDTNAIDVEKLQSNIVQALGEDPAVARIGDSLGADIAGAISQTISQQMSTQMAAIVEQMMGQHLQNALQQSMGAAMEQVMSAFAQNMQASMQSMSSALMNSLGQSMSEVMAKAFAFDENALAEAFATDKSPEELGSLIQSIFSAQTRSYESNLSDFGYASLTDPTSISLYPTSFEHKDAVKEILEQYNADMKAQGHDSRVITYTDMVALLMSSVTDIIGMISAMLIAFVAISLVVSSIMIGIITYISVLERKKEIGILRSIGASKNDIRSVFNAETVLVGLLAGLLGVGITWLLTIPANAIVEQLVDVSGIAQLPVVAAVALVLISMFLTVIAGLLPAGKAAKSNPVEALRAE